MRLANIQGHFLPWRDVLHDGPVPHGLALPDLSRVRAEFIASMGWASLDDVLSGFKDRDDLLAACGQFENVILWFEHDLYDQLQLLQILDWFAGQDAVETRLSLICSDNYLGHQTPGNIAELRRYETEVSQGQLDLAKKAWAAFRNPDPTQWANLLHHDTDDLQFLHGAIARQLEEYPDTENGLSRTARVCLEIIRDSEVHPGRLFRAYQDTEDRMFMGDLSFWHILEEMLLSNHPLIRLPNDKRRIEPGVYSDILSLTETGTAVLENRLNWLDAHRIDRWIGGVHLTHENLWSWDNARQNLVHLAK